MKRPKLPVGIENFQEIRQADFYYVDKTRLIEQLVDQWGKVNLFTRPRRFGKTLNMSMLRCFFEIGADEALFEGLYISRKQELCEQYMGKFPVVFLSLKNVDGLTFENARYQLTELVGREASRFLFLLESDRLTETDKDIYRTLISVENGRYSMDENILSSALQILSQLLHKHYGQKTIILIDEYDVPLDKAFQHGYYKEMVLMIRGVFGQALKTNDSLYFAVLTGCLRVSKESIFTGLNNFKVLSITDHRFDEHFGFTDDEVFRLLTAYGMEDHLSETKEWYDGYHFGNADIYCPWDVINYVEHLRYDPEAEPEAFWINSSENDLVKRFVAKADQTTKDEIEQLIAGDVIEKKIRQDLTYDEIDQSIDNLWSVLFTTGYLTQTGRAERGIYKLMIPNKEVREVFIDQIQQWFDQTVVNDEDRMSSFYQSFAQGKAKDVQDQLTSILAETISILDTKARNEEKENFYHGMMLGLLRNHRNWIVKSNVESGEGFVDILIKPEDPDEGILIELKYSKTFDGLEKACERAMEQVKNRRYDEALRDEGRCHILIYGIAFCKKRCKVVVQKI